jgi:FtsP/CotA-like multicopper oxidase with cupredoxin domain
MTSGSELAGTGRHSISGGPVASRRQVLGGLGGTALLAGSVGGGLGLVAGCSGSASLSAPLGLLGGATFQNPPILQATTLASGRKSYNLTLQTCAVTLGEGRGQQQLSLICYTDGNNPADPPTPAAGTGLADGALPQLNRPPVAPTWVVFQDADVTAGAVPPLEPVMVNLHNRVFVLPGGLPDSVDTGKMDDPPFGSRVTNLHTHGLHVWPQQDNVFVELEASSLADGGSPAMLIHDPSMEAPILHANLDYAYLYNFGSTAPVPPAPRGEAPPNQAERDEKAADEALSGAGAAQRTRLPAGAYWYHPHKHGSVAYQVSNGLCGMMIVKGDVDAIAQIAPLTEQTLVIQQIGFALETATGPTCLVPAGSGLGYVDPRAPVGGFPSPPAPPPPPAGSPPAPPAAPYPCSAANTFLTVNGQVQPVVTVQAGEIQRWRVLNGTYDSFFYLTVETKEDNGGEVVQVLNLIGVDGVPLTHVPDVMPVPFPIGALRELPDPYVPLTETGAAAAAGTTQPVTTLSLGQVLTDEVSVLAPGQRYTALAAIPVSQAGATRYVKARLYPHAHSPPKTGTQILMKINVAGTKATPDTMPPGSAFADGALFRPPLDTTGPEDRFDVVFDFCAPTGGGGSVTLNGDMMYFDGSGPQVPLKLDRFTRWSAVGRGGAHAFHIHINSFRLTRRFGMDISKANIWRDTLRLDAQIFTPAKSTTCPTTTADDPAALLYVAEFESRQLEFTGDFVLHCHALHHEDMGMMLWVQITA